MITGGGTISALLVDDAPEVRILLRVALRSHGSFSIAGEARTGAEAVRLAAELHPDVIVLDLGLPDLAGRDLLAQIRLHAPTSRVVIFTGNDTDRTWYERRAAGFVVKDTDLDNLLDLLKEVGTEQRHRVAVVEVPVDYAMIREARASVVELLRRWNLPHLVDQAQLVVSELVTNALEHAQSPCEVTVLRSSHGVRIEVRDEGPGAPDPQPPSDDRERGRGLRIIAALSSAWGIDSDPTSKVVWAELAE